MKTKDRLNALNANKQTIVKKFKSPPGNKVGKEGDLGVCSVPRKGLHLFYKHGGEWHGTRLERLIKTHTDDKRIPTFEQVKIGKEGTGATNINLKNISGSLVATMDEITEAGKSFKIIRDVNEGSPFIQMGSSDDECLQIIANYDSGGKGMDFAEIRTKTASGTINKGTIKIYVDDALTCNIDDGGFDVTGVINATGNITTTLGDLSIGGGDVTITAANDNAASIIMAADNSDDAGDDWKIIANADQTLSIGNDINSAGSFVTHLEITPNATVVDSHISAKGDFSVPSHTGSLGTGGKIFLDGGGDTYIQEYTDDILRFTVGGDVLLAMTESGTNGNAIVMGGSVGFSRLEQTFSTTDVIGSGGTDDTDIDFRFSNKYRLEMTGDITTMNLIFPLSSGNFLLVCTTNGDHDVTNWKVWENDESAATTTDVMWAGGAVPAFTSSGIDIVSFYWDATEEQAYGTVTTGFATP